MGAMTAIGIPVAILVFLIAGAVWYQLFGMALSFWVGLAAGGFTFKYFYDLDKKDLANTLNPPEEVWPVPYPVAWGSICDVLRGSGVDTGASGRSIWNIVHEDDSRGSIQAKLSFNQMLGVGRTKEVMAREIHLNVQLTAEGAATRVKCVYEVFSPMGAGMVKALVRKAQEDFKKHMEVNRIQ